MLCPMRDVHYGNTAAKYLSNTARDRKGSTERKREDGQTGWGKGGRRQLTEAGDDNIPHG